jgi:hypothetical protein
MDWQQLQTSPLYVTIHSSKCTRALTFENAWKTSLEIIGLSTREQLMEAMSRNERLEACIYICYISYI